MSRILASSAWSPWLALGLVACTPAGPPADVGPSRPAESDAEAGSRMSHVVSRPIVYACREPAAPDSGYRFELDGVPLQPAFVSLTGDAVLRPGDILRIPPASMIAGPPGHYRYFTDPARPRALELEFDGGPRHLVALRVAGRQAILRRVGDPPEVPEVRYSEPEAIDRPLAELRQLRGLALETWSEEIAATVARLDGAQLMVRFEEPRGYVDDEAPALPSALPPDLRALELSLAGPLRWPSSEPVAPTSWTLEGLPALAGLRSLSVRVDNHGAGDRFEVASLGRFPALQRLALDSSLPSLEFERLRGFAGLQVLELAWHHELRDLEFVLALPALRRLDVERTGVTSLASLAGHPGLEVVQADGAPVAALPSVAPPRLRELSVVGTRLSEDAVEAFAAAAPGAIVRHGWNQRLVDAGACATRVHVRTGGVCHRRPERERTLFAIDDPAAVRELLPLLQIDEPRSDSYCMCCGTLTIELLRGDEVMAEVTLHHGHSLRYSGWPADGKLVEPGPLCSWLARHGAPEACPDEG